MISCN